MPQNPAAEEVLYSPAVSSAANASFGIGSNLTWDAFVRQVYEKANVALSEQASALVRRGNISMHEAHLLVDVQRNALVTELRKRLSPFARLYSEILKPTQSLPTLQDLLRKKGSIEAVLASIGKSRAVVNRFAAVARVGGPGTIVIQFGFSAIIIASASPQDRGRSIADQTGAVAGAALGGWGGAWAGCATLATLASPSLAIPYVGQIGTASACLIGGIAGGLGAAWVVGLLGQRGAGWAYDFITELRWITP